MTEDTSRQRETTNSTISQLGTNRPSDQRPVVLLNSVYQLLNYVINERWEKNVEPANILEPGQGGGRQGRCVGINMQKVHFIQQEARRQGKRVYRVDIAFKNVFNVMSQAVLWQVMGMFKIPDVDILEQIYEGATFRLAPNDEDSATITFNTGVVQGSVTSPQSAGWWQRPHKRVRCRQYKCSLVENPSFKSSKCHGCGKQMKTKGRRPEGIVFTNADPRYR